MTTSTPRQDYLQLTRTIITALQSHVREFEDHHDILSRGLLNDAYKAQAALIQQHFAYLSAMYDKEFPVLPEEPVLENTPASSIILL